MLPTILNRDFQHPKDGWYHIEPKGEHLNAAAGVVQVLDDKACETIVNRFNAAAQQPDFAGMLVDHEHFRHDAEKETRAYGWLTRLQNRADGIYGQIRWTDTGRKAVDGGDYRFFSTEYLPAHAEVLNVSSPRRLRPMRLAGLTLTNQPNNRGGRPITNREELPVADCQLPIEGQAAPISPIPAPLETSNLKLETSPPLSASTLPAAVSDTNKPKMKDLAKMLGLPEDAAEAALLAAVTELKNRGQAAEAELLKNREAQADADLEPLKDKFTLEERTAIRAQLVNNRAATLPLLRMAIAGQKPAPGAPASAAASTLLNRAAAKTPAPAQAAPASTREAISSAIDTILNRDNCGRDEAFRRARKERPELFAEARS